MWCNSNRVLQGRGFSHVPTSFNISTRRGSASVRAIRSNSRFDIIHFSLWRAIVQPYARRTVRALLRLHLGDKTYKPSALLLQSSSKLDSDPSSEDSQIQ